MERKPFYWWVSYKKTNRSPGYFVRESLCYRNSCCQNKFYVILFSLLCGGLNFWCGYSTFWCQHFSSQSFWYRDFLSPVLSDVVTFCRQSLVMRNWPVYAAWWEMIADYYAKITNHPAAAVSAVHWFKRFELGVSEKLLLTFTLR